MQVSNYHRVAIIAIMFFTAYTSYAQLASAKENPKSDNTSSLKTYVIRREIPNAGKLTPAELKAISQTSCSVLKEMGPRIEWVHSYVTGNQIYCIYRSENEEAIREHAKKGGFPANEIIEVHAVISPATADAK